LTSRYKIQTGRELTHERSSATERCTTHHKLPATATARQEQLERLGWRFHRIWSTDWFYAKEKAVEKVIAAYEHALRETAGGVVAHAGVPPSIAVYSNAEGRSLGSIPGRL